MRWWRGPGAWSATPAQGTARRSHQSPCRLCGNAWAPATQATQRKAQRSCWREQHRPWLDPGAAGSHSPAATRTHLAAGRGLAPQRPRRDELQLGHGPPARRPPPAEQAERPAACRGAGLRTRGVHVSPLRAAHARTGASHQWLVVARRWNAALLFAVVTHQGCGSSRLTCPMATSMSPTSRGRNALRSSPRMVSSRLPVRLPMLRSVRSSATLGKRQRTCGPVRKTSAPAR